MLNPPDQQEWVNDDDSDHCLICCSEFSFFNRRHHCRSCGSLVCNSCSSKTAIFWDEKRRWTSSQRVCDSCARRREVEVLIGNRFHDVTSNNLHDDKSAGVIMIVIKSITGLGFNSTWGVADQTVSTASSRSLSCSVAVGGKSLGQTTTKLWNAGESKVSWDESFTFRIGTKRPFKAAEFITITITEKVRSGLSSSESVVGYLRCPIVGMKVGGSRSGWCMILGSWEGSSLHSNKPKSKPLVPFAHHLDTPPQGKGSSNGSTSTKSAKNKTYETQTPSKPELRSPVARLHLDLFRLPPPQPSNLTSWSTANSTPSTPTETSHKQAKGFNRARVGKDTLNFVAGVGLIPPVLDGENTKPLKEEDTSSEEDVSFDTSRFIPTDSIQPTRTTSNATCTKSTNPLDLLMELKHVRPDVHFPVSGVPFGSIMSDWACLEDILHKGSSASSDLVERNFEESFHSPSPNAPFLGYHLGLLTNWFVENTPLHDKLFRRFGPGKHDVVPQNEYALEAVSDVELRWGSGFGMETSLGRGALVLTTHRLLFMQSSDAKKHPVVVVYLPTIKSSVIKKFWKGVDGQSALEVVCTDARSYIFIARDHDNLHCHDHRDRWQQHTPTEASLGDFMTKEVESRIKDNGHTIKDTEPSKPSSHQDTLAPAVAEPSCSMPTTPLTPPSSVPLLAQPFSSLTGEGTSRLGLVESKFMWIQQSIHWLVEEDNFSAHQCLWDLTDGLDKPSSLHSLDSSFVPTSPLTSSSSLPTFLNEKVKSKSMEDLEFMLKKTRNKSNCAADYNVNKELMRLGIIDPSGDPALGLGKRWRISLANESYQLCNSYPRSIVVPTFLSTDVLKDQIVKDNRASLLEKKSKSTTSIPINKAGQSSIESDEILKGDSKVLLGKDGLSLSQKDEKLLLDDEFLLSSCPWRTMNRLPVLTWLNQRSGAAITRSSQPKVGITGGSCLEDELVLMSIREASVGITQEEISYLTSSGADQSKDKSMHGLLKPSSLTSHIRGSSDSHISRLSSRLLHTRINPARNISSHSNIPQAGNQSRQSPLEQSLFNMSDSDEGGGGSLCYEWTELRVKDSDESGVEPPIDFSMSRSVSAPILSSTMSIHQEKGTVKEESERDSCRLDRLSESPVEVTLPLMSTYLNDTDKVGANSFQNQTLSETDYDCDEGSGGYDVNINHGLSNSEHVQSLDDDQSEEIRLEECVVLRILDARPLLSAKANAAMGKGHEVVKRLGGERHTTLSFLGLPNIHAVRDAYEMLVSSAALATLSELTKEATHVSPSRSSKPSKMTASVRTSSSDGKHVNNGGGGSGGGGQHGRTHSFMASTNASALQWTDQWLELSGQLIAASTIVAQHSEAGDPVLIHCSDGWDRTSQVSSLALFLLDPYYRTIEGFQTLVEKDWCAFGHQFRWRCSGAGANSASTTMIDGGSCSSPIFLQWVDAVWQIKQQFPTHVEFNDELLLLLVDAAYSRQFSNFRENCDSERYRLALVQDTTIDNSGDSIMKDRSTSLWKHVNYCKSKYKNDLYLGSQKAMVRSRTTEDKDDLARVSTALDSFDHSESESSNSVKKDQTFHESIRGNYQAPPRLRPVLRPDASPSKLSLWRELLAWNSPLRPPVPPREELLSRITSTYHARLESLLDLLESNGLGKEAQDVLDSIPLQEP